MLNTRPRAMSCTGALGLLCAAILATPAAHAGPEITVQNFSGTVRAHGVMRGNGEEYTYDQTDQTDQIGTQITVSDAAEAPDQTPPSSMSSAATLTSSTLPHGFAFSTAGIASTFRNWTAWQEGSVRANGDIEITVEFTLSEAGALRIRGDHLTTSVPPGRPRGWPRFELYLGDELLHSFDEFVQGFLPYTDLDADAGDYRLLAIVEVVSCEIGHNYCWGGEFEGALNLTVTTCLPDWDGELTSADFFAFLDAFFAGDADANGDGSTTSADFFAFLDSFFAGC